jgi:hypothetical protein
MSIIVNAYCTSLRPPHLDFPHELNSRRDHSDPELRNHLNGFQGYILEKGDGDMTGKKYHLLRHIQRVNHQISFNIEEANYDSLKKWSVEANAILFMPDGTVRSPDGNVLFYPDGRASDCDARVPFMFQSYNRKSEVENILKGKGIPAPSLPPLPCELELKLRSEKEIFLRAMALFVVALRAESILTENPIETDSLKEQFSIVFDALSPAEQAFLDGKISDENQIVQFAWRYEGVALLMWVLGILPELPFPKEICDVSKIAKIALDWDAWKDKCEVKNIKDVLDVLDLHYRLHWLCRQSGIDGTTPSVDLDCGVLFERHYALNWLIHFENSDWDDVDTPT